MPMNPEIKAQWVADLRSGEFEQGTELLNMEGKFCCLGVLCDQAVKAGVIRQSERYGRVTYDGTDTILPTSVRKWAGLPDGNTHDDANNPEVIVDNHAIGLAELNDGADGYERHTFAEIADLIEEQL